MSSHLPTRLSFCFLVRGAVAFLVTGGPAARRFPLKIRYSGSVGRGCDGARRSRIRYRVRTRPHGP